MKQATRQARRIGDELVSKAVKTSHGLYWKTLIEIDGSPSQTIISPDIYSGASGVALYLIDLYLLTKEEKFLKTAKQAMDWVVWYAKNKNWKEYSFYIGRSGASYVLIKLYSVTGNKKYFTDALSIAKGSTQVLKKGVICDFLLGVSGTILGLLHLHSATKQKWILSDIRQNLDYLLSNVNFGKEGIYWDRSEENIRGLCSFSHGASGVGFVLFEMGRYFDNPAYYWLAEQAFAYEDYYYDKERHNWPDFRKIMGYKHFFDEAISEYKKGNYSYFSDPSFMFAWCHGGPGIILSRLRACEALGEKKWLINAKDCWEKHDPVVYKHGLCHGVDGLSETGRIFGDSKWEKYLDSDLSDLDGVNDLFNGIAGIGYRLLRQIDKNKFSVLYPILEKKCGAKTQLFNDNTTFFKVELAKKIFPDTLKQFTKSELSSLQEHLRMQKDSKLFTNIAYAIKQIIDKKPVLKKVFDIEKYKFNLDNQKPDVYLAISNYVNIKKNEELLKLSAIDLKRIKLKLIPEVSFKNGYIFRQTHEGVKIAKIIQKHKRVYETLRRSPCINFANQRHILAGLNIGILYPVKE